VSLGPFRDRLLAIWRGERLFESTALDETVTGLPVHVALRWSIPPGQMTTLGRVLLAKTDITGLVEGESRLRRALDGTIEAIGRATETRDPYTAGHQRRMAELAVAVARKLGLDESVVEATRAAGLLHDIGKLSIPAEILSKPSALSPLEMSLIKTHSQSAYDVLRTIDFPWPVANIVLQHHERMDGSGYPQGLSGDAILVEARVLAVADVVEAMSSHRPYRAALGIEAALAEVERGRGVLYDVLVVDACLDLFRVEGFCFSSV
jgi:putative nucleotidyltransferase with HDIG domain